MADRGPAHCLPRIGLVPRKSSPLSNIFGREFGDAPPNGKTLSDLPLCFLLRPRGEGTNPPSGLYHRSAYSLRQEGMPCGRLHFLLGSPEARADRRCLMARPHSRCCHTSRRCSPERRNHRRQQRRSRARPAPQQPDHHCHQPRCRCPQHTPPYASRKPDSNQLESAVPSSLCPWGSPQLLLRGERKRPGSPARAPSASPRSESTPGSPHS